ncbi:hypothetical protein PPL_06416 [Heterostelium album PN500]|uniref:Uncharacterized protein n=1 Tax=Heterostelium pallidum (strain ATCC 26659 / Pp 5 / PN500) TaxID=670386 RepID=D3BD36_HETP5|nr:hypothetical protein PPL_06416 [Heterostelium album PN500]EFA80828.1 hypothetical protein PPL_06416 [Heterostelium album PN500]|eukprot:XP_020432947.1 hypothetical protein PPL_06416 [Heterostelium album PN500]
MCSNGNLKKERKTKHNNNSTCYFADKMMRSRIYGYCCVGWCDSKVGVCCVIVVVMEAGTTTEIECDVIDNLAFDGVAVDDITHMLMDIENKIWQKSTSNY